MIGTAAGVERLLRERLGEGWGEVRAQAERLAEEIRFLPWCDRARVLDAFCWAEAQRRLSTEEITGVVNRQPETLRRCDNVRRYAEATSAALAASLALLGEEPAVEAEATALTFLLTGHEPLLQAAVAWIEAGDAGRLQEAMVQLPGFAFLFLILYPNDSAESFMARDAFWAAMLGRY